MSTDDVTVAELTTLSVAPDGSAFRMGLRDVNGTDASLVFPSDAVKSLMMSLFRVGDTAFKRILNDDSARLVYPIDDYKLQWAPGTDRLILVLRTPDGFEAAFAVSPMALKSMAKQVKAHEKAQSVQPGDNPH